jgi:hypothetical protein
VLLAVKQDAVKVHLSVAAAVQISIVCAVAFWCPMSFRLSMPMYLTKSRRDQREGSIQQRSRGYRNTPEQRASLQTETPRAAPQCKKQQEEMTTASDLHCACQAEKSSQA